MFKSGDTVLYGSEGVCKITEITTKKFGNDDIEYYILSPVFRSSSTFFVPTQNEKLTSKMHHLLTLDKIMQIIENSTQDDAWIENESLRKESFRSVLSSGEMQSIVSVYKCIVRHKEEIELTGKKLHKHDEIIYKDAHRIIYEQLSMFMDLSKDDVENIVLCKK
ncbi:MAG: hypothetical protein IJB70_08170 [Clostridia bacterium]|nr:hypothetical protein [Clostridia bacterium]